MYIFRELSIEYNRLILIVNNGLFSPSAHTNNIRMIRILAGAVPDSKVHGARMGPIWGRQDPGGHHVGPMNFAIWDMMIS